MTDVRDAASLEELIPDKQRDLAAAKQAIAGPVPLIPEAPDTRLTLPRGLYVKGVHKKEVVVRELNGADEEALAKAKDPQDLFDLMLALGTVSIDDFNLDELSVVEREAYLRMLLIGERDQVFLAIIKVSFGETKTISFTCSACGEKQDVDLLLSDDFKPQEVPDDLSMESFDYRTTKGHDLVVRLVTGEDQSEAFSRKNASIAEQNTIILSRCIVKLNGGLVPDPMSYARSLSIKDRSALLADLMRRQPSINLGVTTQCAACNADQSLPISWGDLFRS